MRGRFRIALVVGLLASMALAVQPAGAIQYGQPDDGQHPFAGALVFYVEGYGTFAGCSGTLIGSRTVLTAAHCAPDDFFQLVGVTFDEAYVPGESLVYDATEFIDDDYDGSVYTDYAVVILTEEVVGITPATLPVAGQLDNLTPKAGASKEDRRLTAVGYGSTGLNRGAGQGQPSFVYPDVKMKADTFISNINKKPLGGLLVQTSAAPGTGGGTCYGDSGGPFFLAGTNIVVAITITGYNWNCGGADINLRIDVPDVLAFINANLE